MFVWIGPSVLETILKNRFLLNSKWRKIYWGIFYFHRILICRADSRGHVCQIPEQLIIALKKGMHSTARGRYRKKRLYPNARPLKYQNVRLSWYIHFKFYNFWDMIKAPITLCSRIIIIFHKNNRFLSEKVVTRTLNKPKCPHCAPVAGSIRPGLHSASCHMWLGRVQSEQLIGQSNCVTVVRVIIDNCDDLLLPYYMTWQSYLEYGFF